jgi:hypothetical protein
LPQEQQQTAGIVDPAPGAPALAPDPPAQLGTGDPHMAGPVNLPSADHSQQGQEQQQQHAQQQPSSTAMPVPVPLQQVDGAADPSTSQSVSVLGHTPGVPGVSGVSGPLGMAGMPAMPSLSLGAGGPGVDLHVSGLSSPGMPAMPPSSLGTAVPGLGFNAFGTAGLQPLEPSAVAPSGSAAPLSIQLDPNLSAQINSIMMSSMLPPLPMDAIGAQQLQQEPWPQTPFSNSAAASGFLPNQLGYYPGLDPANQGLSGAGASGGGRTTRRNSRVAKEPSITAAGLSTATSAAEGRMTRRSSRHHSGPLPGQTSAGKELQGLASGDLSGDVDEAKLVVSECRFMWCSAVRPCLYRTAYCEQ